MIKRLIALKLLFMIAVISYSQNFNGYKYVLVPNLTYQNGSDDIYGISNTIRKALSSKGFVVLNGDENLYPKELKSNRCLLLICYANHNIGSNIFDPYTINLTFKNCKNETVYSANGDAFFGLVSVQQNLLNALNKALYYIAVTSYSFNPNSTPVFNFPDVESTSETEDNIKEYLLKNPLDPLEGIYKSYQDDNLSFYKIGIIK
jgi:hypothetical protein